ncbi:MAG: radical SAM protein [Clostridia bacterium]|nr:radical SAM protein [Clostridia bacterium]
MYYRLKEPWAFRGWKKLPFAIRAVAGEKKHEMPFLLKKEPFLELLCCNGEEDVDISTFSGKGQQIIREMTEAGLLEQSPEPLPPLAPFQRYHVYPSRYLKSAHWSITGKCNFQCRHCLVSAPAAHHPQLPLSDCLHIVDEMAECGILKVDITGGEPLVRNDFEEIVKALSERHIDIGVLFTNASLLTAETLDMLEKYRQHPSFQLSFDGLGHHDWLRGVPGAEKQADTAFRLLQERGFAVSAAMCIHRENRDSLRDTYNYLAKLGVRSLKVNAPQSLGLWKQYADEYALSEDEVWAAYSDCITHWFEDGMPIELMLDGYFFCRKGETEYKIHYVHHAPADSDWRRIPYCESVTRNVYIGPDGRLAPCMGFSDTVLKEKFPSVLEHPLGEMTLDSFYHDLVETKISDLLAKNPQCVSCEYLPKCCGGCMVQDITDEGDYLVPDSRCCYFHKHIGEQTVRAVADAAIAAACR